MVKFRNVSEYSASQPIPERRKILGGPLYDLNRVRSLIEDGDGLHLWTKDSVKNVLALGWDHVHVTKLLHRLKIHHYIDSEWCENGNGAWAACDAYCIQLKEWISTANKEMVISYFVKFSINRLGTVVLVISCHT
jgi:hypothetical protein